MTAHECEEYIEEPPQRKRYAFRKPERQRDFLRLKLTLPSERRTGKPPPDPLLVLCRLQAHRGSRCSTVTKIPDTTPTILSCILELKSAKEIWDTLLSRYEAKKLHDNDKIFLKRKLALNNIFLRRKLYTLRMSESNSMIEHINIMKSLFSQ